MEEGLMAMVMKEGGVRETSKQSLGWVATELVMERVGRSEAAAQEVEAGSLPPGPEAEETEVRQEVGLARWVANMVVHLGSAMEA